MHCSERGSLGTYGRLQEVDGIIAHAYHQVEDGQHKQKDDDAKVDCFHIVTCMILFWLQNYARRIASACHTYYNDVTPCYNMITRRRGYLPV